MTGFKKFEVVEARGFILWILNVLSMFGWTSIWGKIYIHPNCVGNERLLRHEQCHAMQIQRDGRFVQPLKYLYYTIKFGYRENPYEVEAREAEEHDEHEEGP